MSNYLVWAFGYPKFTRSIGGADVVASFPHGVGWLFLKPVGIEIEDIDFNDQVRIKGFKGFIKTRVPIYDSTTKDELVKLIQIMNDLVSMGSMKTVALIPKYDSAGNAVNESFDATIKLGSDISFSYLTEVVESVQYLELDWKVPGLITTIPAGTTTYGDTVLTGDDDETLTGDDDEDLTEG